MLPDFGKFLLIVKPSVSDNLVFYDIRSRNFGNFSFIRNRVFPVRAVEDVEDRFDFVVVAQRRKLERSSGINLVK
jgi:hypothetical protein